LGLQSSRRAQANKVIVYLEGHTFIVQLETSPMVWYWPDLHFQSFSKCLEASSSRAKLLGVFSFPVGRNLSSLGFGTLGGRDLILLFIYCSLVAFEGLYLLFLILLEGYLHIATSY
jgi:hypothetical protein